MVVFTYFPRWLLSRYWPIESRSTRPFTLDMLVTAWEQGNEKRKAIHGQRQDPGPEGNR